MQMYFADSKELQEETPVAKNYSPWELNSGSLTFMSCLILSELISYFQTFNTTMPC